MESNSIGQPAEPPESKEHSNSSPQKMNTLALVQWGARKAKRVLVRRSRRRENLGHTDVFSPSTHVNLNLSKMSCFPIKHSRLTRPGSQAKWGSDTRGMLKMLLSTIEASAASGPTGNYEEMTKVIPIMDHGDETQARRASHGARLGTRSQYLSKP